MYYWDNQASVNSAMKTIHRQARQAMAKTLKQRLADATPRREAPPNVPKRGRMMRQVLDVPESSDKRTIRALITGFLFSLIGGAIALLTAGVPLKGPPPPGRETEITIALIVTAALGIIGFCIGYFTGRKKLPKLENKSNMNNELHSSE